LATDYRHDAHFEESIVLGRELLAASRVPQLISVDEQPQESISDGKSEQI